MKKIVNSVEDVDVFKEAHKIALEIYGITKTFPQYEKYTLVSYMRRVTYEEISKMPSGLIKSLTHTDTKH